VRCRQVYVDSAVAIARTDRRLDPSDPNSFTATSHLLSAAVRDFMNAGLALFRDNRGPSYQRPVDVPRKRVQQRRALLHHER
jgi:hypothetical protein